MANTRWEPKANAVSQIDTITCAGTGDWVTGDTITITINTKTLVITVGASVTDAGVAITIKEAWEAETFTDTTASVAPSGGGQSIIEFAEITATVSGAVVTLTHDTPGVPFTMTVTETTTGDETATQATATAATGPNHWDNTLNWSNGIPVNNDSIFIDNSDVSILYGLDQSSVSTGITLTIAASYTGNIGLPNTNEAGYSEYRDEYLQIGAGTLNIGGGAGSGSGRLKIDIGSVANTTTIESTGSPLEDGVEAVLWKGSGALNTVNVYSGSVGLGSFGGETVAVDTLRVTNGTVKCGPGCTVSILSSQSGDVTFENNAVTVTIADGTVRIRGTATVGTLNLEGGTCQYLSSGTITTANIGGQNSVATLDVSQDMKARTITTCNLRQNGRILDPVQTIVYTNNVDLGSEVKSVSAD